MWRMMRQRITMNVKKEEDNNVKDNYVKEEDGKNNN